MTFDEAIEELRLAIPKRFYSPTMHDIAVMLEAQTKVINLLREEYAPTVEMTAKEKGNFLSIANSSVTFANFYEQVLKQSINIKLGIQASPELYKQLSENELIQAWLHPETIKVVDE